LADLNAVDAGSSPAIFAGVQHLSGVEYSQYLYFVAEANQLPIACECKVQKVTAQANGGFHLDTEEGPIQTDYLIWACGEFQFPDLEPFPGADLCWHYAQITDWRDFKKRPYTVIGGYESGLDSAINLLKHGCEVNLLVRNRTWDLPEVYDPSQTLSPYTRQRLRDVEADERLTITYGADVVEVTRALESGFTIDLADGRSLDAQHPPILGTGFVKGGGARQVSELWEWNDSGNILLSEIDESVKTPGLFLVGPQVRHEQQVYCFIYKFRQRFAFIAKEIAGRKQLQFKFANDTPEGAWGPFGNSECCENCEC
ncbi:MAG: NAD(P)-binding domain-containing protein, partial [Pseudomonadota bacterium]